MSALGAHSSKYSIYIRKKYIKKLTKKDSRYREQWDACLNLSLWGTLPFISVDIKWHMNTFYYYGVFVATAKLQSSWIKDVNLRPLLTLHP